MKILWVSQHSPTVSQLEELRRIFGEEAEVAKDPKPFSSAEEIAKRFRDGGYNDIVIVAPMSVISRLIDLKIKPFWAEMIQVKSKAESEVEAKGRFYRFNRFRRIKALRFEFEEV